jgi:hypothetical protein
MPCHEMGIVRLVFALLGVLALVACASAETQEPTKTEEELGEAPRVPNPPPKYPHSGQSSVPLPDGGEGGDLQIKCSGWKPYVCTLDDGTFVCSDRPCVPDCSRVGCIGGEVCQKCEGGFVCLPPGSGC